ncbi:MAG TPA: hypothetical protein VFS41_07300, partial [Edaphobacter sp.]|nr:hypothetical protein [Edaphobacter sp.]
RGMVNNVLGRTSRISLIKYPWLLVFGVVSVISALVFPLLFSGIPVYDPKIGIDDGLFIRPPLHLGVNNFIQSGYLICHILVALSLSYIKFSPSKTYKAFIWAFYLEFSFVFAESVFQLAGIPFPLSIVLNNPGYALWDVSQEVHGTRNPGTFSEPSLAGAFLVLFCIAFLAQYLQLRGRSPRVILSLVASGMVASTTSLFALCLVPLALLIRYSPFRAPWHFSIRRTRRIVWILVIVVVPLLLVLALLTGYRDVLATLTVSKGDSGSFINRTASDLYSLHLLIETYGIGVGLGSNRTSSLLSTLLSNVGLVGTLAYGLFCFRLFSNLPKEYSWLKWAAAAFFLNVGIAVADVTMPMLWFPIFIAMQYSAPLLPVAPYSDREKVEMNV